MNSWTAFMLQQTKPRVSGRQDSDKAASVSLRKPVLVYDVTGYRSQESEAYTAQQKFARRLVQLNEDD